MQPLPSLNKRYTGVPGQNLFAPVLDRPDLQFDDSTPGFDAAQQLNVDQSDLNPDPIPRPDPASPTPPTGPAAAASTSEPAVPSGKPDASNRLKDMPAPEPPPPPPPPAENTHPMYSQHIQDMEADDDAAMARDAKPPQSNYDKLQALQPPPKPPPAKWYQKLGAVALGAAGGYSQAAGRAPIDPRVIAAGEEGILRPGYSRKLATYEQQRDDLTGRVKTDIEQERRDAEADARGENAETRRLNMERQAKEDREKDQARDALAKEKIAQDKRVAFEKLKGTQRVVYVKPGTPVPDGFTQLQDPDRPDEIALVASAMVKVPKELVDEGLVPGLKAGDWAPSEFISKAYDAHWKIAAQKTTEPRNPTRESLIQDANDPTSPTRARSKMALDDDDRRKEGVARAGRADRPPSAAELNREHQDSIRKLAQRALRDSAAGGGGTNSDQAYDNAILNVVNPAFYQNDEMDENREEVKALLNRYKNAGLPAEKLRAQVAKANAPSFSKSLGLGGPPAPPPAGGGRGAPAPTGGRGATGATGPQAPQRIPVSEGELRKRLTAAGKNVEAGVAAAKQNPKYQMMP